MSPNTPHPVGIGAEIMPKTGINQLRFDTAEDLLGHGGTLIDETGCTPIGGVELILAVQATRASNTFESIILLCENGRGVQAAMLNRSLFEDVLDVHWVAANPIEAPKLADDHEQLTRLGERKAFIDAGNGDSGLLTAAEKAELGELMLRYNNFHEPWNLASENERRGLIRDRWGEEAFQKLGIVYDVIQQQNNILLHGSPIAYKHAMTYDQQGRPRGVNRIGIDHRWLDSLGHGALAYYFICRVVAEHFSLDKKPAAEAFHKVTCYVKELSTEEVDGLEGDDACPCGSGRFLSDCHASPTPKAA